MVGSSIWKCEENESGGPWCQVHLYGNMKRTIFTEGWSLVLGSSVWKCEENAFHRGVVPGARFIYMEM